MVHIIDKIDMERSYGMVDNLAELEPADDAATQNWGSAWQTPTREQQDELRNHCTWSWTTRNGVYGQLGTAPNGKTLFLPAAGYRDGTSLINDGSFGYYWSHTLYYTMSLYAYSQDFSSGSIPGWNDHERSLGHTIRLVRASQ